MLHSLEVLNGEMSPKFEDNNLTYTVFIENNFNEVVLNYKTDDDTYVEVIGNHDLKVGDNTIYLNLIKDDIVINTYTIYVTKSEEYASLVNDNVYEKIEVTKELPIYVAPLIIGICFVLIMFTFFILFHKRK